MSVLLLVCGVAGYAAQAEDYPTRSVKLITQGAAASGPDVVARIVAEPLGRLWGQQVVILNHPGAGGSVANSQCTLSDAGASTITYDIDITVPVLVTFTPGFAGYHVVFTSAQTSRGEDTGWRSWGTWQSP